MNKKDNVCGVLVAVDPDNFNDLLNVLSEINGCEVIESKDNNTIALVVEDTPENSAYDVMEYIKNIPFVLSISLINHFFE